MKDKTLWNRDEKVVPHGVVQCNKVPMTVYVQTFNYFK